jgi:hypothetical protein
VATVAKYPLPLLLLLLLSMLLFPEAATLLAG